MNPTLYPLQRNHIFCTNFLLRYCFPLRSIRFDGQKIISPNFQWLQLSFCLYPCPSALSHSNRHVGKLSLSIRGATRCNNKTRHNPFNQCYQHDFITRIRERSEWILLSILVNSFFKKAIGICSMTSKIPVLTGSSCEAGLPQPA